MVRAERKSMVYWALVVLVVVLAGVMRLYVIDTTIVDSPYRADSAKYYDYAYNLRHHGVYTYDHAGVGNPDAQLLPDALCTPGYPLFLVPFASGPATYGRFHRIGLWQVVLGTLAVVLAFLLFRRMLSPWLALLATTLVAISPQQIIIATYNLSENLFTPLLLLVALVIAMALSGGKRRLAWGLLGAGVVIGLAALTRPVLEYFVPLLLLLLWVSYPRKQALTGGALVVLGFALMWGPWVARNIVSLGQASDPKLLVNTVHQGMYPGMMYNDDPQSLGVPYRFDPDYKHDDASLGATLAALAERFGDQPGRYLAWYLIGKPVQLWSWDLIANGPRSGLFIYPTPVSPYRGNSHAYFVFTYVLMQSAHGLLVILAFLSSLFVLLPVAARRYPRNTLLALRIVALLLIYNTLILMIGAPYTRYSWPFLPLVLGMAWVLPATCLRWLLRRNAELKRLSSPVSKVAQA